jgi:hypothetical protein
MGLGAQVSLLILPAGDDAGLTRLTDDDPVGFVVVKVS